MTSVVICGIVGFLVSWGLIPVILERARRSGGGSRDKCFHQGGQTPIPRFGGVAIASSFLVVVLLAEFLAEELLSHEMLAVILGSVAMFGLGILDDCHPIGARMKLVGQIVIASVVAAAGSSIEVVTNPLTGQGYNIGAWGVVATVIWLVALTNLINIIDGIDGLAGGISLMLMVLMVHEIGRAHV